MIVTIVQGLFHFGAEMNGFAFVLIVVYLYSAATLNDKLVQDKHKCPLTRLWCGQYNIEISANWVQE